MQFSPHALAPASKLAISVIACVLIGLVGQARAEAPLSSFMPVGAPMFAPKGFIEFCERRPDQCDLASSSDRRTLERMINRAEWANIFQFQPNAIGDAGLPSDTAGEAAQTTLYEGAALLNVLMTPAPADANPVQEVSAPQPENSQEAASPTEPRLIAMTEGAWDNLNRINRSINARIHPMSDEQAFGVVDYWSLPLSDGPRPVGNCKHYVLEKRKALVEAGAPASALSIAIVRTDRGEAHAVLIVATDRGDLVLDNLSQEIKGWRQAPYAWLSRQAPGRSLEWAAVPVNF